MICPASRRLLHSRKVMRLRDYATYAVVRHAVHVTGNVIVLEIGHRNHLRYSLAG